MILTNHAQKRWEERFPEFDVQHEWAKAKGIGRGRRRKLLLQELKSPRHRDMMKGPFQGHYYLFSKLSGAVFVVAPPEVVITVLKLPETKNDRAKVRAV